MLCEMQLAWKLSVHRKKCCIPPRHVQVLAIQFCILLSIFRRSFYEIVFIKLEAT